MAIHAQLPIDRRCAAMILLPCVLVLAQGCQMLSGMQRPTASVKTVGIEGLTLEKARLRFDLEVANPYSFPLPLVDLNYDLASGGKPFATGTAPVSGTIPAGQSQVIPLPVDVPFADLFKAVRDIRPGSVVPYTANLRLSVNAPALGAIALPLRKDGEIPIPAVPEVELTQVQWKTVDLNDASGSLSIRIKNTNSFALNLAQMSYAVALGGTEIAKSSLAGKGPLAPGGEQTLEIPVTVKPINLGMGFFNILRGKGSSYSLSGLISADTPYGTLSLPYQKTGQALFK